MDCYFNSRNRTRLWLLARIRYTECEVQPHRCIYSNAIALSTTMAMAADDDVDGNHTMEDWNERKWLERRREGKKTRTSKTTTTAAAAAAEERVRTKTLAGRSRSIAPTIELYQAPHFVLLTGARDGLYERRRRQRHSASSALQPCRTVDAMRVYVPV